MKGYTLIEILVELAIVVLIVLLLPTILKIMWWGFSTIGNFIVLIAVVVIVIWVIKRVI